MSMHITDAEIIGRILAYHLQDRPEKLLWIIRDLQAQFGRKWSIEYHDMDNKQSIRVKVEVNGK